MIANGPQDTRVTSAPPYPQQSAESAQPTTTAPAPRRYNLIFGVTLTVLTLAALVLAFFASDFRQSGASALPSTWTQAYNADLTTGGSDAWDQTHGCDLTAHGLDATSSASTDAVCGFQPSVQSGVTSAGFYFITTVAPAANVPAYVTSIVSVGDLSGSSATTGSEFSFIVTQAGAYTLCDNYCSPSGSSSVYLHGGLAAWHGNAQLSNTIALKVTPDHSALTFYVNGQQVATVTPQFGPQPGLALGAAAGSESIYTHATLYTGS